MTREEAVKELKIIREDYWDEYNDPMPALDMAIKALEQQPCEDWNAVLDELKRIGRNAFKDDTDYDNLFNFISGLPNVKQEPRTGHWILDETDNSITCDRCGCLIWANDISNGDAYYCPNCGAKMESEES